MDSHVALGAKSETLQMVLVTGSMLVALLAACLVLAFIRYKKEPQSGRNTHILLVLGSGGHTSEMIAIVGGLDNQKFDSVTWVLAESDETSLPKLQREAQLVSSGLLKASTVNYEKIPRSREVGQSWISSAFSTAKATIRAINVVFKAKPGLILMNGPGTCVPVAIGGILSRIIHGSGYPRMVFIESFCRVDSLSMSGKILYPFVDRFIVQWKDLTRDLARAEYLGCIF